MTLKLHTFLGIACLLLLTTCSQELAPEAPSAQNGLLDLSEWDFRQDGMVNLDGEWVFYWESLIGKEPASASAQPQRFIPVPSAWNNYQWEDQKLPGFGYASYQLTILLSEHHPNLSLKLLSLNTSYNLYINGRLVASNGKVGTTQKETIPYTLPQVCHFSRASNRLDIILEVANFYQKSGGVEQSILLGTAQQIQKNRDRLVAIDLLIAGSLLIMAFYHFGIYLLRRQDLSALYFSLVGILIATRTLLTNEKYLLHLFPFLPWALTHRLEYMTVYLGFPFYVLFFHTIYPQEFSGKIANLVKWVSYGFTALVLVTPAYLFTQTFILFQFLMLMVGNYVFYALILAMLRKRDASRIFLFGFVVFFAAVTNELLLGAGLIESNSFLSYGLLIFIFSQSFVLSVRYARAFSEVEELTSTLEKRVQQRTAEIRHQNRALERQKNEISSQAEIIERKNENITASIMYASRIQRAILGSQEAITSNFKDSFIFLEPRDIVSGDFYWYTEVKRSGSLRHSDERQTIFFKVIVAADCTGHGIPGAFMTVLGNALLDEIINENRVTNPSRILSVLDRKLLMKLRKHEVNDGMDLAILIFDEENRKVTFAGANNPLYYAREGVMHQIKGSKFPIGSYQYGTKKKFTMHTVDYQQGDAFYMFSDGFQDQFGGTDNRKYYKKNFREFLLSISHLPMSDQKRMLKQEYEAWKGDQPQTDDILVLGIRT